MQKKIIKFFNYLIIIFITIALTGCKKPEEDKSWRVFLDAIEEEKKNEKVAITVDELQNLFDTKFDLMESIVQLCEQYPSIRRVGNEKGSISYYGENYSSLEIETALDTIRRNLSELSASSTKCGRRGDYQNNPLSVVKFTMYTSGLGVSGSSKGIIYRTDWYSNNNKLTTEKLNSLGYSSLGLDGWYTYQNES